MAVPSTQNPKRNFSFTPMWPCRAQPWTEGNQPCSRCILSSIVYPQDLWSPLMPKVLLLSRVNQPSQFFPAHTTAPSVCAKGTGMWALCTCSFAGRGPKFSSLDAGRLCLSEHVSVGLLQLLLQLSLPKQLHRAQHLLLMQGHRPGEQKNQVQTSSLLLLHCLFLCKIWHLTLTRIQCGEAHIINCC